MGRSFVPLDRSERPCADCGLPFTPMSGGPISVRCKPCQNKVHNRKGQVAYRKRTGIAARPTVVTCRRCGAVVPVPGTVGNPPRYCDDCRIPNLREKSRESYRRRWRPLVYGLSEERYDKMMAEQGGTCAICHQPDRRLFVDHDHKTNVVRGLLCPQCNAGLGMYSDDPQNLINAWHYLKRASEQAV